MSVEGSPWWRGPSTSLAEGSGSMWLVGGGGISGFGVCRARRGRPRFLFMGGVETCMMEAVVCVLLELQRLQGEQRGKIQSNNQCQLQHANIA